MQKSEENRIFELFVKHPEKTCLIIKNSQIIFTSECRGVKPLLDYYMEFGAENGPLTVADKIMGKGAVVLAVLIGAEKIITPIISEAAFELAKIYNIETYYNKKVPYIVNREGDGQCPIEKAVIEINDIEKGYGVIIKTLENFQKEQKR